ncbi:MAG TPA: ABC transporter ATP-binding protein [Candidatus Limnocylindrales bacterium]|nr:ABC transporter ATP-binding protein [Candidatus Limnocylindrales bacterium]
MEVRVENLTCTFGQKTAVQGVSFTVPSGSVTALLGPSGCGKTTVLRSLAGLHRPDAGTIRFGDQVVFSAGGGVNVPPERRALGMIFQDFALWPHMRVFDNVAFGLRLRHLAQAETRAKVMTALEMMHLQNEARRFPHQLSGGQQQRVAVARAIVSEPQLLLLDEPLSSLDAGLREEMRQELSRLIKRLGITAVHVTHDHVEALSMASQMIVLNDGRIEQSGDPVEIYERPGNLFVARFLGVVNVMTGKVEREGSTVRVSGPGFSIVGEPHGPINGHGHALIRPSSIRIVDEAAVSTDNDLTVQVTEGAFHGERWQFEVVNDAGARLRIHTDAALPLGARIRISFAVDACRVIPATENPGPPP